MAGMRLGELFPREQYWQHCQDEQRRVERDIEICFNLARPHQGIEQRIPEKLLSVPEIPGMAKIIAFPILNRLHHDYRLAA
jgi:hypothetical protein